jgi:hypothetical protein
MPLEPPFVDDDYHDESSGNVPKTLRVAIQTLKQSKVPPAAFGSEVIDHYVHATEWEQHEYDCPVTDWELIRCFTVCWRRYMATSFQRRDCDHMITWPWFRSCRAREAASRTGRAINFRSIPGSVCRSATPRLHAEALAIINQ